MNKRISSTLVAAATACLIGAGALLAADPPRRPTSAPATRKNDRERYVVLTDQNIFLKNRRDGRPPASRSAGPLSAIEQALRTPEASFVLTGVVFEDGDFRAFIEDIRGGKVLRLSVGDPVARGKITEIDIDTAAYLSDGKQTIINVGQTLTGIPYSAFASSSSPSGSGSSGSGGGDSGGGAAPPPLPDPNNPNLTIEDRLKLRRAAELKK